MNKINIFDLHFQRKGVKFLDNALCWNLLWARKTEFLGLQDKGTSHHSVQKVRTPPLYGKAPYMTIPPFYLFSEPRFRQDFFDNITPMKYWINTKINSCGKVNSSFLEDWKRVKNNATWSFYKKYFYKQQLSNNVKYQKESKIINK